jgi:hypothetical protein
VEDPLVGRLRRQVALTADTGLSRLLNELRAYPCDEPEPEVEIPGAGDIVVPLRLRYAGRELAFFSTVTTFGTPLDVTVSELAIESFFSADHAHLELTHATPFRMLRKATSLTKVAVRSATNSTSASFPPWFVDSQDNPIMGGP